MKLHWLFVVLVPLVLILGSGRLFVFNTGIQNPLLDYKNSSGINNEVISYLEGNKDTIDVAIFTDEEKAHMQDVKVLLENMVIVFYIALSLLLLLCSYYFKYNKKVLIEGLFQGGATTLGLMLILLTVLFFNFTWTFDWFHRIFFPQGNYSFSTELTKLYTANFFSTLALRICGLAALIAALLIANKWKKVYL